MIQLQPGVAPESIEESEAEVLVGRLTRGADLLFDMEQRGETGPEYETYFDLYRDLLRRYEAHQAA